MGRFKGQKDERRALAAFVKLMRAAESISRDVHKDLAEELVSVSQFGVLEALFHLGPLCQKEIASKILKSSGNLTTVIGNLEKRDLVTRERDLSDKRYFTIRLTEKGRALIAKLFPAHAVRITKRMSVLSKDECRDFSRLCRKLGRGIE